MVLNGRERLAAIVAAGWMAAACGSSSGGGAIQAAGTPDAGSTPVAGAPDAGGATTTPAAGRQVWVVPESAAKLDAAQQAAFGGGALYYNAHTAAHPGGEIRGQLDHGGTLKVATLDGAQETPAVTTSAFGAAAFAVDEATGRIAGLLVTSGLDATAAHVHLGARGAPGAIIVPLKGGPDTWVVPDDAPPLTAAQISAWQAGQLYVNAHSAAHPSGEIRGQLDHGGTARFAALAGAQEVPATTSSGHGGAVLLVDDASGAPGGFVLTSGLVSPTAAHVHLAAAGAPGPVILPLSGGPDLWVVPDGAAALTTDQRSAFGSKGLYYNVHTAANPGGEIRGQLTRGGTARLASLDGVQETPAVPGSPGFGAGLLALDDGGGGEVGGFLVTAGLEAPTAAHAHDGARGTPGPVIVPLAGP